MYAFEKITQSIRQRITDMEWGHGGRLPSSRELSQYYDVSVNTVEKALKELTQSGLLKRDSRRGTYVNNGVTLEGAEEGSGLIAAYVIGIDNPLWASALRGIEDVLRQHGFHLLPSSYGESMEQLTGLVKGAMAKKVDGVIMCPPTGPRHNEELVALIETLARNGTRVVFLDRHVYELDIPFVASDNIAGAYQLTKRLIALGHERILFIRNSNLSTSQDRLLGFKRAYADAGLPYKDEYELFIPTSKEKLTEADFALYAEEIGRKLTAAADEAFTAVFTSNDQVAEAALPAIEQQLGLRVPEDLSLVTYDADNLNRRLKRDIAGINQPFYAMGQLAAKQLLHLIRGKQEQAAVYGQICKAEFARGSSTSAVWLQSRGSGG